jgi:hypothetical protein
MTDSSNIRPVAIHDAISSHIFAAQITAKALYELDEHDMNANCFRECPQRMEPQTEGVNGQ